MSLEFTHVILYSKNKDRLSIYISELLDASITKKEEGIEIKKNNFSIMVCNIEKIKNNFKTTFHFSLDTKDELREMWKKVQFLWFRLGERNKIPIIMEERKKDKIRFFFKAEDIDGNYWIFSC